jgi:hypothetical protein
MPENKEEYVEIPVIRIRDALSKVEAWCRGIRETLMYLPSDTKARVPKGHITNGGGGLPLLLDGCPPPEDDDKPC